MIVCRLYSIFIGLMVMAIMSCNHRTPQSINKNDSISLSSNSNGIEKKYFQLHSKFEQGIDFIATGNEPFWSVEIDFEKYILFKTVTGDSVLTMVPEEIRLMDVAASSYRVNTDKGTFSVIIYDKPCVNDMSGDTLPKMVEVHNDTVRFSGCGQYMIDYRINDIWVLDSLNGSVVKSSAPGSEKPRMEINLAQQKIFGFGSCNEFSGNFEPRGRRILFRKMISTLKTCPDMELESRYLRLLSGNEAFYRLEEGKLLLNIKDNSLVFRKVD